VLESDKLIKSFSWSTHSISICYVSF